MGQLCGVDNREIERKRIENTQSRSKRGQIMKEFFLTENTYVDCLKLLRNEYLGPLSQPDNQIMNRKVFDKIIIFKDFETIFEVHQKFLARLEETVFLHDKRDEALVELVIEFCDYFRLYSDYIKHFRESQNILAEELKHNTKLDRFLNETAKDLKSKQLNQRGGKDVYMLSLLITPIQRLPRYLLMMKDLLKVTRKDSRQYKKMIEVIARVEQTIKYCNEKSKDYNQTLRLIELSEKLNITLRHETLYVEQKVNRVGHSGKYRPCELFLFDDVLVIFQLKNIMNTIKGRLGSINKKKRKRKILGEKGQLGDNIHIVGFSGSVQWNINFLADHQEGGVMEEGGLKSLEKFNSNVDGDNDKKNTSKTQLEENTRLMLVAKVEGCQSEMKLVWESVGELTEFFEKINMLRKRKMLDEFSILPL